MDTRSLLPAPNFVATVQERQGVHVASPENAWRMGYIDDAELQRLASAMDTSRYAHYRFGLLQQSFSGWRPEFGDR